MGSIKKRIKESLEAMHTRIKKDMHDEIIIAVKDRHKSQSINPKVILSGKHFDIPKKRAFKNTQPNNIIYDVARHRKISKILHGRNMSSGNNNPVQNIDSSDISDQSLNMGNWVMTQINQDIKDESFQPDSRKRSLNVEATPKSKQNLHSESSLTDGEVLQDQLIIALNRTPCDKNVFSRKEVPSKVDKSSVNLEIDIVKTGSTIPEDKDLTPGYLHIPGQYQPKNDRYSFNGVQQHNISENSNGDQTESEVNDYIEDQRLDRTHNMNYALGTSFNDNEKKNEYKCLRHSKSISGRKFFYGQKGESLCFKQKDTKIEHNINRLKKIIAYTPDAHLDGINTVLNNKCFITKGTPDGSSFSRYSSNHKSTVRNAKTQDYDEYLKLGLVERQDKIGGPAQCDSSPEKRFQISNHFHKGEDLNKSWARSENKYMNDKTSVKPIHEVIANNDEYRNHEQAQVTNYQNSPEVDYFNNGSWKMEYNYKSIFRNQNANIHKDYILYKDNLYDQELEEIEKDDFKDKFIKGRKHSFYDNEVSKISRRNTLLSNSGDGIITKQPPLSIGMPSSHNHKINRNYKSLDTSVFKQSRDENINQKSHQDFLALNFGIDNEIPEVKKVEDNQSFVNSPNVRTNFRLVADDSQKQVQEKPPKQITADEVMRHEFKRMKEIEEQKAKLNEQQQFGLSAVFLTTNQKGSDNKSHSVLSTTHNYKNSKNHRNTKNSYFYKNSSDNKNNDDNDNGNDQPSKHNEFWDENPLEIKFQKLKESNKKAFNILSDEVTMQSNTKSNKKSAVKKMLEVLQKMFECNLTLKDCFNNGIVFDVKEGFPKDLRTKFFVAVKANAFQTITQILEENRFLVYSKDCTGKTALHWAVKRLNIRTINLLLKYKPFIDETDVYGNTPLFYAQEHEHQEISIHLLKERADPFKTCVSKVRPQIQDHRILDYLRLSKYFHLNLAFKCKSGAEKRRMWKQTKGDWFNEIRLQQLKDIHDNACIATGRNNTNASKEFKNIAAVTIPTVGNDEVILGTPANTEFSEFPSPLSKK